MKLKPACRRCHGKSGLIIRLGEPGQDWRDGNPIRWQEPWSVKCPVCKGAGVEMKPPRKLITGSHVIVDDPAEDLAFTTYLINRWRLNHLKPEDEKF